MDERELSYDKIGNSVGVFKGNILGQANDTTNPDT